MKKLILAVLVMATFGANATQLTQEQQARVDKFNDGWTSLSTMQIQRNDSLKLCRLVVSATGAKEAYAYTSQLKPKDLCDISQTVKNKNKTLK
jgi:hypothetical protein